MNLATIKEEVMIKLQDPDPELIDRLVDFINEAVNNAIEEVEPESFKVYGTVTTASRQLAFTNGDVAAIAVGNTITGLTSGATALVTSVSVTGAWDGSAAGTLGITTQVGTFESETITTGTATASIASDSTAALYYTSMPSNFSGKLLYIGKDDRDINQHNLQELVELFPDMDTEGNVTDVAVEGSTLYYQGIPTTAETLVIIYRKNPTEMTSNTDEPDGIPELLHRKIIVCGAAMNIWNEIEDGIEGQKINTAVEKQFYDEGIALFHGFTRKRTRNSSRSVWRY
jgi:hypothetical protein